MFTFPDPTHAERSAATIAYIGRVRVEHVRKLAKFATIFKRLDEEKRGDETWREARQAIQKLLDALWPLSELS